MRTRFGALHALVALSALAVACGGSTFDTQAEDGGTDSGADGGTSGTASSGTGSSGVSGSSGAGGTSGSSGSTGTSGGGTGGGCPASPPTSGSCSPEGLTCEWGTSNVADCDTVATCTGGLWSFAGHNPGGLDCGGGPPIACPGSYAAVPVFKPCSPSGGYCDYPEGRCACGTPPGPVQFFDGSVASVWECENPSTPGCPQPRPRLGSACMEEGLSCDYGGCGEVPGGNAEACKGGIWVTTFVGCPL
jgi:hypothetical protein